jgi:hypothetical protein
LGFAATHRLVGRCDLIRRREFMLQPADVTTVNKLARLGFSQTEHLRSKRFPDVLNQFAVGIATWEWPGCLRHRRNLARVTEVDEGDPRRHILEPRMTTLFSLPKRTRNLAQRGFDLRDGGGHLSTHRCAWLRPVMVCDHL